MVSPGCALTGIVTVIIVVAVVIIVIIIIRLAGKHPHFVFAHRFPSGVPVKQKLVLNEAGRAETWEQTAWVQGPAPSLLSCVNSD